MFGLFRRRRQLREFSTKELLRRAYNLGWSASRACGAYTLVNHFQRRVASAPMNEQALRELLAELIRSRRDAPP